MGALLTPMAKQFITPLEVEFLDGDRWKLISPLIYVLENEETIYIPAGFYTDFASVPRGLWNILPPIGRYGRAAVLHDYLYQRRLIWTVEGPARFCTRGEADSIFRQVMGDEGINVMTRWMMYSALRTAGWAAWRGARKRERKSE